MVAPTAGPRRTDSLRTYVRATRITGGLGVLVVSGAIAWDFTNDRFWSHHALLTSLVASFIVVGVMSVIALGLLEPANIAVLVELKKRRPNPAVIERLMKRFIYAAGILGAMQIATLVIMTKIASS